MVELAIWNETLKQRGADMITVAHTVGLGDTLNASIESLADAYEHMALNMRLMVQWNRYNSEIATATSQANA